MGEDRLKPGLRVARHRARLRGSVPETSASDMVFRATAYPIRLHAIEPSIFDRSQLARDMAGPSFNDWIDQLGLRKVRDPHFDKPVYRKAPFGNLTLSADIEKKISASFRRVRDKRKIPRSKFAPMLGVSEPVYVRYERAVSKLTGGRLLHICELLDVS
ncbi:XRE family transcriptional regulator, partial [Mesorhizobium sp. M6A.T.Ca.TU.002.02.2.1]